MCYALLRMCKNKDGLHISSRQFEKAKTKVSALRKGVKLNKEWAANIKAAIKKRYKDPSARQKTGEAARKYWEEHPEAREQRSLKFAGEGNPAYGYKWTDEQKQHLKDNHVGTLGQHIHSEEYKKQLAVKMIGNKNTLGKHWKWSDEQRAAFKEVCRKREENKRRNNK